LVSILTFNVAYADGDFGPYDSYGMPSMYVSDPNLDHQEKFAFAVGKVNDAYRDFFKWADKNVDVDHYNFRHAFEVVKKSDGSGTLIVHYHLEKFVDTKMELPVKK